MPRDVEDVTNTYCLFCGWPIIVAEDPNQTDFCEHVLFVAMDEGGVTHVGDRAREYLTAKGVTVTAWGAEWEISFPSVPEHETPSMREAPGESEAFDPDEVDEEAPAVADTVRNLADAFDLPEGLLIHDRSGFLGDPDLYIALGRW